MKNDASSLRECCSSKNTDTEYFFDENHGKNGESMKAVWLLVLAAAGKGILVATIR